MKKIVCFSGGKDSTAMLIHLLETKQQIDEILYVDVGDWMWKSAKDHIQQVQTKLNVDITIIDVSDELDKGFQRWGFPSMFNRWCTGIKKEVMGKYLKDKYNLERESIVQYIGYCANETKRTGKKLYSSYETEYPLVDAGITTSDALQICKDYGFDFGGVYEHHSHFNCWLCPLQKIDEFRYIYENEKDLWEQLRQMQLQTDGTFLKDKSVFELEHKFWLKKHDELREKRMNARKKYNKRGNKDD